jgi:hypothetical protein
MNPTTIAYRSTGKPCKRCGGDGIYRNIGICFRCGGPGFEVEEYERPMTDEEVAKLNEYEAGIAAREQRASERAARRAARELDTGRDRV